MRLAQIFHTVLFRVAQRIGPIGVVGVFLLIATALTSLLVSLDTAARRESLEVERRVLVSAAADAATRPIVDEGARLVSFHARFVQVRELPDLLNEIHARAVEQGVSLARADYRSIDESGVPLLRIEVRLPVRGEFRTIYAWLNDLLQNMPNVALQTLSVSRTDPHTALVEGEARLAVYVRRGSL